MEVAGHAGRSRQPHPRTTYHEHAAHNCPCTYHERAAQLPLHLGLLLTRLR